MPGAFWTSWQLWEKMCFVLGCSIFVVILLGGLKLMISHWRLRKYTAIAATKAAVRQEMRHTASVRRARGQDIPFGVRALESGVEVDGIWVSGTNTPMGSTHGSPAFTPKSHLKQPEIQVPSTDRSSTSSGISRLEIPQPALSYQGGSSSAMYSEKSKARSSEGIQGKGIRNVSSESSTYMPPPVFAEQNPRGRDTYQPRRSSGLRFSNADTENHSAALAVLEQTKVPNGQSSSDSEDDIDGRRRSFSWAGSNCSDEDQNPIKPASNDQYPDRFLNPPHSALSTASSEESNPFLTPTRVSSQHITTEPQYDGSNDSAAYHTQTMRNGDIAYDQGHARPIPRFEADKRPHVARKINSGFEILRPGTLDNPRQSMDTSESNEVSGNGNKRQSRKLQRKRRSSGASHSFGLR